MATDSEHHSGEHHAHHHAHKNQSSRFLLLAVPFLLILILLTVAISMGTKQQRDELSQYPAETDEYMEGDSMMEEPAEAPGQFVGEPVQQPIVGALGGALTVPTDGREFNVVTNVNDLGWKEYKPVNVNIQMQNTPERLVKVSWELPRSIKFFPYSVMIGFDDQSFNPVEKFKPTNQLTQADQIKWKAVDYSDPLLFTYNDYLLLRKSQLPATATRVHFYIYVRVKYSQNQYADYIYGANGTAIVPFTSAI